jgi:hypothetical protein
MEVFLANHYTNRKQISLVSLCHPNTIFKIYLVISRDKGGKYS